jgi:hypothetical protein
MTQKIAMLLILGSVAAAQVVAQEKKIKRSDLPPAVEKNGCRAKRRHNHQGIQRGNRNGQKFYEAEMTVNGHSKDVLMDASGAVVEVEEEVAQESLFSEVKAGLQAKAGNGKIVKVESLTKKGKLVAYEAKLMTNGKKSEVQVGPDGKPLGHEE